MTIPILQMEGISKRFPGVLALDKVQLEVMPGEVLGLLGENGAGKSTLMKILSGVYRKDTGAILLNGQDITVRNPHHARTLGITIIHQELNLMPTLTVAENIFIGREPNRWSFVQWQQLYAQTYDLMQRLGIRLAPTAKVNDLSVAERQMVEIARALSVKAQVIIMDEPTSALTENEVQHLFATIRELKAQGLGIIFISHRMEEVFEICDRITVLRDGEYVGTVRTCESSPDAIIRMMVGRAVAEYFGQGQGSGGESILEVRNLSRIGTSDNPTKRVLSNINLQVRRGEIVGIAGLVGAGRTELARSIFGVDPRTSGALLIEGLPVQINTPRDAIRLGIGMVPEDRKLQALFLGMSVEENASIASMGTPPLNRFGFIQRRAQRKMAQHFVQELSVRFARYEQPILDLSGGNQQKVVIARWLALNPKILIMDEPTRGIDVGAKAEVHSLMRQLAQRGVAVLMISSELPEVLAMSDRVLVMHEGELVGELSRQEATPERVMVMMTGEQTAR